MIFSLKISKLKKTQIKRIHKMKKFYDITNNPPSKGIHCTKISGTQQHFKEECNINSIMAKFAKTGQLTPIQKIPQYGDFSNIGSYDEALNQIEAAQNLFGSLPAYVRDRFNNNPGELIAFMNDESNRDEAIKLGFIPTKEEPKQPAPISTGAAPLTT